MIQLNTRQVAAIAMAFALAVSGAGLAMAAVPSIDSDGADPDGTTSEIVEKDTIVHNESALSKTLQYVADSNNSSVIIKGPGGDVVYENSSYDTIDAANNTWEVAIDPTGDFTDLEAGANENVTLNATIVNDTALSSPDKYNFTLYYKNGNFTRMIVDDSDADDEDLITIHELSIFANIPIFGSDTKASTVEETVPVNGENTSEIRYTFANGTVQDSFVASTEEADDGAWLPLATVKVNDHFVPAFANEAPDNGWIDTDEDAYAVIDASDGSTTVHNAGDILSSEDTETDITLIGNKNMGMTNAFNMFGEYEAPWPTRANAVSALDLPFM